MIWSFLLICGGMTMMTTPGVEAQEPPDTITDTMIITIRGNLAQVEIAQAEIFVVPMRIGDTGNLVARAFDEAGDPIDATYFWEVSDPTKMLLTVTSDSTATITALRKTERDSQGNPIPIVITLKAVQTTEVAIGAWRSADGKFLGWNDNITLPCAAHSDGQLAWKALAESDDPRITDDLRAESGAWCSAQLCAYALRGNRLVLASDIPPTCPALWEPVEGSTRPMSDRVIPFYALASTARIMQSGSDNH